MVQDSSNEKTSLSLSSSSELSEEPKSAPAILPSNFGRLCEAGILPTYLEYTKNQGSPTLFHVWTAIAVIAGILRRNVYIERGGYYTIYPNFYIVLVAPTGRCMKSTAAGIGVRLLRRIDGLRIMHEKITPEGLIHYMSGQLDSDEKRPLKTIVYGKNAIIRKDCNCFIFVPELSVFLGTAAYTGGLIELLTSLYEGKDHWEYRTKTGGTVNLENVNINLFGASNPEWLSKGLQEDSFGGGFMGRTIYVFQESGRKIAWPEKPAGMDELEMRLVHDLIEVSKMNGEYTVDAAAKAFYQEWFDAYDPDFNTRMAGYYERKPTHVLKLSIVLAASQSNVLRIRKSHVESAIQMLDEVELLMPKAFAYIGATSEARISQHIIEQISGSEKRFISYKRLLAGTRHMIKNRREFDDILDTLETAGAVKIYHTNSGKYLTIDPDVDKIREAVEVSAHRDAVLAFEREKAEGHPTKSAVEETREKLADAIKAAMKATQ